jgi:hypothetical protein
MSDIVLQSDAFRPNFRLKRGRPSRHASGPGGPRRLRLKRLGNAVVDYVKEVMAEMDRARHIRPVISAYRP